MLGKEPEPWINPGLLVLTVRAVRGEGAGIGASWPAVVNIERIQSRKRDMEAGVTSSVPDDAEAAGDVDLPDDDDEAVVSVADSCFFFVLYSVHPNSKLVTLTKQGACSQRVHNGC